MRSVRAALLYFGLVFAVGCLLGPVRELWVAPRLGTLGAVLAEAPLMAVAMAAAARWAARRTDLPAAAGARLLAGLLALIPLALAELAGSVWLRGRSLGAYLAGLGTPAGIVSLALFALYAAMPALTAPGRDADRR